MATDIPRADRYAEVVELRNQGLTYKETAARMGISLSYVRDLLYDPDGAKSAARKASYSGVCQRCGDPTDGSNGRALAPKLCWDCFVVENTPNHGTYTRYDGGCRCEACRAAKAAHQRTYMGKPPPNHGVSGYGNYGCRCEICTEAWRQYEWLRYDEVKRWKRNRAAA